jgi:hypothetical protein
VRHASNHQRHHRRVGADGRRRHHGRGAAVGDLAGDAEVGGSMGKAKSKRTGKALKQHDTFRVEARELRALLKSLEKNARRVVQDVIAIGRVLGRVKKIKGPAFLLGWLKQNHFRMSEDTVERYIRIAEASAKFRNLRNLRELAPSAILEFAHPDISQEFVDAMIARGKAGERITAKLIRAEVVQEPLTKPVVDLLDAAPPPGAVWPAAVSDDSQPPPIAIRPMARLAPADRIETITTEHAAEIVERHYAKDILDALLTLERAGQRTDMTAILKLLLAPENEHKLSGVRAGINFAIRVKNALDSAGLAGNPPLRVIKSDERDD